MGTQSDHATPQPHSYHWAEEDQQGHGYRRTRTEGDPRGHERRPHSRSKSFRREEGPEYTEGRQRHRSSSAARSPGPQSDDTIDGLFDDDYGSDFDSTAPDPPETERPPPNQNKKRKDPPSDIRASIWADLKAADMMAKNRA